MNHFKSYDDEVGPDKVSSLIDPSEVVVTQRDVLVANQVVVPIGKRTVDILFPLFDLYLIFRANKIDAVTVIMKMANILLFSIL